MSFTRRDILKVVGAAGLVSISPNLAFAQVEGIEKKSLTIAVGGQALVYYLPLSIADLKGFFKEEGLDVKIVDFAGGSKALQAVVGGSADVCSGAFEHTISLQNRRQNYSAFVMQGRAPMITLGVSTKNMPDYKEPADLKGKKIGVTAPGSSTNMLLNFFLAKHGLSVSDVSIIGVGAGTGAVNAMRSGQIDAISNVDPVISTLEHEGLLNPIVDTRRLEDSQAIFGGPMPSSCLYASHKFIEDNPNTCQALANAIIKADKWIQAASLEDIIKTVPEQYLLGNPDVYRRALEASLEALSPDGIIDPDGPQTALNALDAYNEEIKAEKIDLSKVWNDRFVKKTSS
ncbi:alkanesulfonate transporter substrate-binding subunit [Oligella urethralis]|uniref:ABC transporter substrate-binding protein n=1 Tax=Oligella urethralis TaxID=90245 RepID=UPI000DFC7A93|nr:ABC transporter substrate-binding protein [Oligella urethralis]SUA52078.1 alkanesulfonate transporter substrate-binding subunit [Oligella urethralis]